MTTISESKGVDSASSANQSKNAAQSLVVLSSALQLGIDIVRDLLDTGNVKDEVKGEHVTVDGIRNLLTASVMREIKRKATKGQKK